MGRRCVCAYGGFMVELQGEGGWERLWGAGREGRGQAFCKTGGEAITCREAARRASC